MYRHVLAPVVSRAADALGIARTLPTPAGGVALTFDDGPHPEGTPAILDVLSAAAATATFFMVGEQVQRRPALAAEIAARGHAIALHCHSHRLQLRLGAAAVAEDIERGGAAIEDATGHPVAWHRPPYGIYSSAGLQAVRAAGLRPILWSHWGKDWRRFTTPSRIASRATRALSDGDVILLHDADFYSSRHSYRRTAQALSMIVAELARRELDTVLLV